MTVKVTLCLLDVVWSARDNGNNGLTPMRYFSASRSVTAPKVPTTETFCAIQWSRPTKRNLLHLYFHRQSRNANFDVLSFPNARPAANICLFSIKSHFHNANNYNFVVTFQPYICSVLLIKINTHIENY